MKKTRLLGECFKKKEEQPVMNEEKQLVEEAKGETFYAVYIDKDGHEEPQEGSESKDREDVEDLIADWTERGACDEGGRFEVRTKVEEACKTEELNDNDHDDFTHKLYGAVRGVVEEFMDKGLTDTDLVTALEFVEIHLGDEFDFAESLKEDDEETEVEAEVKVEEEPIEEPKAEEPKLETFDEQMDFLAADEQEAIDGYDKVLALVEDEHVKAQLEKILEEERAHKDFLEKVKEDKTLEYSHEEHEEEKEDEEQETIKRDNMEIIDTFDDIDDDFGFGESLKEDTVKQGNKWVNKGEEGTHGKFNTKKEADAQRKAMFANGYHEDLDEEVDDDFGGGHFVEEEAEDMGVTVDWNDMDDEDDAPVRKHCAHGHCMKKSEHEEIHEEERHHETGHIKARRPIELRARR